MKRSDIEVGKTYLTQPPRSGGTIYGQRLFRITALNGTHTSWRTADHKTFGVRGIRVTEDGTEYGGEQNVLLSHIVCAMTVEEYAERHRKQREADLNKAAAHHAAWEQAQLLNDRLRKADTHYYVSTSGATLQVTLRGEDVVRWVEHMEQQHALTA